MYGALGVSRDGVREVPGLWIAEKEGAKFWLSVMNELKNRGVQDMPVAVVDGLTGFPEAIHSSLSAGHSADLYRPSGAPFPDFLCLEGSQGCGRRSAPDLRGRHSRSGGC